MGAEIADIKIVLIEDLKPHEQVIEENLKKLIADLKRRKLIINPVIVDENNMVILDGHHRVAALKKLGYAKAPVYFVNYYDKSVRVVSRRKNIRIDKKLVVARALANWLFPPKTTKHYIAGRPKKINVHLDELRF